MSIDKELDAAITKAASELTVLADKSKDLTKSGKESSTEVAEETTEEDEIPEGETEEIEEIEEEEVEELSEDDLKQAKTLFKTLKDPDKANSLIAALAAQVGLLKPENLPTGKTETKEAAKSITQMFQEALGDDYKFLGPSLGKAVETVLTAKIEELRAEHATSQQNAALEKTMNETKAAENKLNKETKGDFGKRENQILQLMNQFLPGPNQSVEQYLRGIYTMAAQGNSKLNAEKTLSDKVRKNSNDVHSRLSSTGGSGKDITKIPTAPSKPGIKHAVEFAYDQLASGKAK